MMNLRCSTCEQAYPLDTREWRCACGGVFELEGAVSFSKDLIETDKPTLWRYRAMLPIEGEANIVSLGEGFTPLIETDIYGMKFLCKLEFLAPTGSFKDRGATALVSKLKEMGVKRVLEDSSGNAGASLAAYCARAGIEAEIYVPAHASPAKLAQIAVFGAKLVKVDGPRENAASAAQEAARAEALSLGYYASHYYNPFSIEGLKTFAYEVCEQLGWRAPDNVIFPVGHGTLLLGAYRGFKDLQAAGIIAHLPRLLAVQARSCAPIYKAYRQKRDDVPYSENSLRKICEKAQMGRVQHSVSKRREVSLIEKGETIAEGINIINPVRGREILQAVRETGGNVLTASDEETLRARDALARRGLYVEPTSAVAIAALPQLGDAIASVGITVVPLTGSGLKGAK